MSLSRLLKHCLISFRKFNTFQFIIPIALVGAITQPVYAKQPSLDLKPSSNWAIENEEDSCRLIRTFGSDDEKVVTIFDRYGPAEGMRLTLAGEPVALGNNARRTTLQFGPTEAAQELTFSRALFEEDVPALIFSGTIRFGTRSQAQKADDPDSEETSDFRNISSERKAAITYLSVDGALRKPIKLELGPMDKPLAALSICVDELMTHWGVDAEKHRKLVRRPIPEGHPGKWITWDDYPTDMKRQRQSGLVLFRLGVDEKGFVTECHIQKTTLPKAFGDAVCESMISRAKFLPALDESGSPIKSFYRNSVRF